MITPFDRGAFERLAGLATDGFGRLADASSGLALSLVEFGRVAEYMQTRWRKTRQPKGWRRHIRREKRRKRLTGAP